MTRVSLRQHSASRLDGDDVHQAPGHHDDLLDRLARAIAGAVTISGRALHKTRALQLCHGVCNSGSILAHETGEVCLREVDGMLEEVIQHHGVNPPQPKRAHLLRLYALYFLVESVDHINKALKTVVHASPTTRKGPLLRLSSWRAEIAAQVRQFVALSTSYDSKPFRRRQAVASSTSTQVGDSGCKRGPARLSAVEQSLPNVWSAQVITQLLPNA